MRKIGKIALETSSCPKMTHCTNPWNGGCGNTDIVVYIAHKNNYLPICRSCWNKIAEENIEWGNDHAS